MTEKLNRNILNQEKLKKILSADTIEVISAVDHSMITGKRTKLQVQRQVEDWASERGIDKPESATKQVMKAMEELGELSAGVNKLDREKQIDSLGDLQVVLIILAKQLGIDYIEALESAYEVIKNRTGKTVDGVFIKDEDLK